MPAAPTALAGLLFLQAVSAATPSPLPAPAASAASPAPAASAAPTPHGPLVAGVGDSITFGTGTSHPPATSFLARAAGMAYVSYIDLGIPAAPTGYIATEVPSIPLDATAVVVYSGTNDVSAASDLLVDAQTAIDRTKGVERTFDALMEAVHQRVPAARLVVVTVRDFGRVQRELNLPEDRFHADARTAATHEWNAHVRAVAARYRAQVVDLEYDPQWYVHSEYGGAPGDVHPNDAGAEHLARAIAPLLRR